ncbi:unnamed protein product [Thlaspi arvense]|uniref:mannose-6-phosphate isomerase n=1 Tax=Thlaspi arvense TaxID=13288 RepID=A0AAU9RJP3_THLAR|nr:unnamed protein product [Thlaspi arvense]
MPNSGWALTSLDHRLCSKNIENGELADSNHRNLSLKSWIEKNPDVLGEKVVQKWGLDLPFLFKVLSVAKALSIQAHPDKELARVLHKSRPDIYKDDNHKPEMALAVTEFEALCGFTSLEGLKDVFGNVPEIVEVVGTACANQVLELDFNSQGEEKVKAVLQSVFTQLMTASKDVISKAVSNLKSRLKTESQVRKLADKEQLVLQLENQYPADVGVIATFLFNYVKLNPGEALYLGANEPHAYISGECIECMATSDNVVRAGLTPKHRDVQTLCSMLTYKQKPEAFLDKAVKGWSPTRTIDPDPSGFPEILRGIPLNSFTRKYLPPFNEFEIDSCILPHGASALFSASPGPSIFIVIAGEGTMHGAHFEELVSEGDVLFAPADVSVEVATSSKVHVYRAGVNSRFFEAS